jgi:diguanylate cyclase (GGDEF)-like protein
MADGAGRFAAMFILRTRYNWRFVARAGVVIALVFAALLSSWIGIDAERRGKEAVAEASDIARQVVNVLVRGYELEALQEAILLDALRPTALPARETLRQRYDTTLTALRGDLDRLGQRPLESREIALLQAARQALERYNDVVVAMTATLRRKAAQDEAAARVLSETAPTTAGVAVLLHQLGTEVSNRAGRAAVEASEASDRARVLLVIFGSVSLLLALYLAHWLGDALAKASELTDRLAELARIDSLTGLPNRRVWDDELGKALDRARRTARPCAVGLIDLDHFKRYNDTRGHQAGDALLREAAQALTRRMRAGDLLARYGGEEFAVLLHGCDASNARRFFERLHGAMPEGQTFSAGVADTRGDEPASDVLKRADISLYRAKESGRDRTVVFEESAGAG